MCDQQPCVGVFFSQWLWMPTCVCAHIVCSLLPLLLLLLPPFISPHNSVRCMNISQLCYVRSRRMEPNNGVSSYYSDESQGNSLHQGRTACIKYVHSIKKKRNWKIRYCQHGALSYVGFMQWLHLQFKQEIHQRDTWERAPWDGGWVLTANYKSYASDEVSGTGKGEVSIVLGLFQSGLNKRFSARDSVAP